MKALKKAYDWLTKFEIWFLFIIFFFATVSTVINVFLRKVVGTSFNWIDELSRFIMLITICLGMSIAVTEGTHPKMDSIQLLFKGKARQAIVLVADIVFAVILVFSSIYAVKQGIKTIHTGAVLATMPLKLWMFWIFVPLGFTGGAIRSMFNVAFDVMGFVGKDPRTPAAAEDGKEVAE